MARSSQYKQGWFKFGDMSPSNNYNIWTTGEGTFSAPERRVQVIDVPGRNGALTIDEGCYKEVEVVYKCFMIRDAQQRRMEEYSGFEENIRNFRSGLVSAVGYQFLTDVYNPEEYYLARYVGGFEPNIDPLGGSSSFDVRFMRDPRRFLVSGYGNNPYTWWVPEQGESRVNPTDYEAKPLIMVFTGSGWGNLTMTTGSVSKIYEIDASEPLLFIDSEAQEVYYSTSSTESTKTDARSAVTMTEFPTIPGGSSVSFSWNGSISAVWVKPRWWRL